MEELAGKVGVEPTLAESESAVLPLDDFPSLIDVWRRVKDSNLRAGCPTLCFRGSATKPLWELALIELVRRAGLEPATSWVETRNSGSTELTPRMTGTRTWGRTKDLRFVRAALCQLSYACACGGESGIRTHAGLIAPAV